MNTNQTESTLRPTDEECTGARSAVTDESRPAGSGSSPPAHYKRLTDRELQVMALASHGKTNDEIADALDVRKETIKSHVKNARKKLQATNCTQAVAKCLRFGMIE